MGQISDAVLACPSTLRSKFKKETGVSLSSYINSYLMEKSKLFLMNPALSISEISDKLGFCDQFYFFKQFKSKFGITPSSYRQGIFYK